MSVQAQEAPPFGGGGAPGRRGGAASLLLLVLLVLLLAAPALPPDRTWYSLDGPLTMGPWCHRPEWAGHRQANPALGDQDFLYYPFLRFVGRELARRGELPLWNPHLYGGVPLAGNAQFPLLYPGHLPLWLSQAGKEEFDQAAFDRAFLWHALARLLCCALGAWFWFRRLGAGPAPAFLGGTALGLGGYMVMWLQFTPAQVFCFIPPALFFLEGYLQRRSRLDLLLYGLLFGCSNLGGYPQTSFFLGGFVLLYALARTGFRSPLLPPFLLASAAGGLAAMPSFLPFLEYLGCSEIGNQRRAERIWPEGLAWWHLALALAGGLLLAAGASWAGRSRRRFTWVAAGILGAAAVLLLDSPRLGADGQVLHLLLPTAWGRPDQGTWIGPGHPNAVEVNTDYLGSALILLALLAPAARPRGRHRLVPVLAAVAAAAWLYGIQAPLVNQVGRSLLRIAQATRATVLLPLAATALAVYALNRIMAMDREERRRLVPPFLALGTGVLLALAAWQTGLWGSRPLPLWSTRDLAFLLLSAAVLAWLLTSRHVRLPALALCALAALDLLSFGFDFNPATPLERVYPETPALTWLRERQEEARRAGRPFRVMGDRMMLRPNILSVFDLSDVRGHDCFDPSAYMLLFAGLCEPGTFPQQVGHRTMHLELRAFDLLGARYYCTHEAWRPPAGWRLVHRTAGARIYENEDALPRAFLAGGNIYIHRAGLPNPFLDPALDPAETVFLEDPGAALPGPARTRGEARITRDAPNRVEVETEADGWSWLVLMDNHYPGWKARLAGEELQLRRAYGLWRCVAVPPGRHKVVFAYEPASWAWGLRLALLGGVLLVGALFLVNRQPRGPIP